MTRTERTSHFFIHDYGVASFTVPEGKTTVLGRVGIDDIEPDLLEGERGLAKRWKETSDLLRTNRIRSKVRLFAERHWDFDYGFLWLSFSFDRGRARKRWAPGLRPEDLDEAVRRLAYLIEMIPHRSARIDKSPDKWIFDIEITDEEPAARFFDVFFRVLSHNPSLVEYLRGA